MATKLKALNHYSMKELKHVAEITISYKPLRPKMPIVKTSLEAYTELKEFFPPDLINLQEQFVVMYFNKGQSIGCL